MKKISKLLILILLTGIAIGSFETGNYVSCFLFLFFSIVTLVFCFSYKSVANVMGESQLIIMKI